MVDQIKTKDEFDEALMRNKFCGVDFFDSSIESSEVIASLFDELSKEYESVKFITVDVNEFKDIANEYQVSFVPTVMFANFGKNVSSINNPDMDDMKTEIDKLIEDGE